MSKILFVVYDLNLGGLQRVVTLIANELKKSGDDIELCSVIEGEPFYQLDVTRKILLNKKNQPWLFLKKSLRTLLYSTAKLVVPFNFVNSRIIKGLDKIITDNKYDVIIACGDMSLYIPILKKKFPNIKFVAWEHNNAKTYMEQYFKRDIKTFIESLEKADHVVCLTTSDLYGFGKYTEKIRCIYNPLTIYNSKKSNLDNKLISFVGRLDIQHKGIDYLVEVASKLPSPWKVVIAGEGGKKDKKIFRELVKKYDASDKIIYKGPLKGKKLEKHFYDSSVYIMTSRWEGMPLVLAEAMSFGLPVISFEQTGANEVLMNGEYGILVPQGNVEKMSEKLEELLISFDLRQKQQIKSIERVKDFEVQEIVSQWKKCLSELF